MTNQELIQFLKEAENILEKHGPIEPDEEITIAKNITIPNEKTGGVLYFSLRMYSWESSYEDCLEGR